MTKYSKPVWDQLRNKTIQQIKKALEKDGWDQEDSSGATIGFRHPDRPPNKNRVVLHMHPKATKGPRVLKGILDSTGWDEDDLARLKLIKKKGKKK